MQLNLLSKEELRFAKAWSHGGEKFKNRRKRKRPLVPGKVTHVVFKSSKAQGKLSLLARKLKVADLMKARARKHFVKIHEWVNMGNHLHLKVSFKDVRQFQNFLRTFAALAARMITGSAKGRKEKFWDSLVFTRVLRTAFEVLQLKGYFEANHREREMGRAQREAYLEDWNRSLKRMKKVRAKSVESDS